MISRLQNKASLPCVFLIIVCIFKMISRQQIFAQAKSAGAGSSSLCNRDDAIELTKQQIEVTRTFDNAVARVAILIRAADLLWPFEQAKARQRSLNRVGKKALPALSGVKTRIRTLACEAGASIKPGAQAPGNGYFG